MDHAADGQAEEAVELAHPFHVALGQIVVDRDDVDALARQGVQVGRERRDERLAFARFHLRDAALMQHDAADDLHVEVLHAEAAPSGLAADGKGLGQEIVEALAFREPFSKRRRLRAELVVAEGLALRFAGGHEIGDLLKLLDFLRVQIAEYFFHPSHLAFTPL